MPRQEHLAGRQGRRVDPVDESVDRPLAHGVVRQGDRFEFGYRPEYGWKEVEHRVPTDRCWTYRRVNGQWPYLPEGMDRDTSLSQQGRAGRLEKGGAVLVSAGDDYASPLSLYRTPLGQILPAVPSGRVVEEPFKAGQTGSSAMPHKKNTKSRKQIPQSR